MSTLRAAVPEKLTRSKPERVSATVYLVFFFQAEDGIRDVAVTGVQTCALPISARRIPRSLLGTRARALQVCRMQGTVSGLVASYGYVVLFFLVGLESLGIPLPGEDRKSTRLNSSHGYISYAVFCLKKKKDTESEPYGITITNDGELWYSDSCANTNTLVRFDPQSVRFSTNHIP